VNLFEGQIVEDEPDHVLIRSDEAGWRHLYRPRHLERAGRQGPGSRSVLRKIQLTKQNLNEPTTASKAW
jgi:hypothetical protein